MEPFTNFFQEAIDLNLAKEKQMTRTKSNAYKIPEINEVFGNKDRLVYDFNFDFETAFSNVVSDMTSAYNQISDFIEQHGYDIPNVKAYIDGICKKSGDKNVYKIGRILEKLKQPTVSIMGRNEESKDRPKYTNLFKTDPIRHVQNNKTSIVISRHPYDIYGMSTGRSWTSCVDLKYRKEGNNSCTLPAEVNEGTLVAYLIPSSEVRPNGKVDLRKPVSRITLKPLRNMEGELGYGVAKPYGAAMLEFTNFCKKWVLDNFNSKVKNKTGFKLANNVYSDPHTTEGLAKVTDTEDQIRQEIYAMDNLKNEALGIVSSKDRNNVHIYYSYDLNEGDDNYDLYGGVYWLITDTSVRNCIKTPTKSFSPRKDPQMWDDPEFKEIAKKYGFYHHVVWNNYYFQGVSINARLGIIKIVYSTVNGDLENSHELGDILRSFLQGPYVIFSR